MKLPDPTRKDSSSKKDEIKEDTTAEDGGTAAGKGLNWLRHAGVGPSRKAATDKKLLGNEITSLGSLEAEIMGLVWEIGRPANGMDIAEAALYKRRAHSQEPIAFSTINTTLRRLADKGLLLGDKGANRTPYYTPTVGREEMAARILNNVSETLLGRSLHGLLPKLVGGFRGQGAAHSDAAEQAEISRLMQALKEVAQSQGEVSKAEATKAEVADEQDE